MYKSFLLAIILSMTLSFTAHSSHENAAAAPNNPAKAKPEAATEQKIKVMKDPILVLGGTNASPALPQRFNDGKHVIADQVEPKGKEVPFLKLNFNEPRELFLLTKTYPGVFSTIMFDWSVTKFVKWSDLHIKAISKLLKDSGAFYFPIADRMISIIGDQEFDEITAGDQKNWVSQLLEFKKKLGWEPFPYRNLLGDFKYKDYDSDAALVAKGQKPSPRFEKAEILKDLVIKKYQEEMVKLLSSYFNSVTIEQGNYPDVGDKKNQAELDQTFYFLAKSPKK